MKFNPQIHHRRSIRLQGYDYTGPGAYFITIVAYQRQEIFGKVVNGEMQLTALGQIARDEWMRSTALRHEIRLNEDEFIIMPNHIHGIVWIVAPADLVGADGVRPNDGVRPIDGPRPIVGADGIRPIDGIRPNAEEAAPTDTGVCHTPQPTPRRASVAKRMPKSLSSFIAGFKAAVTSRAGRELDMTGIWQRNYYDHIIRNDQEFTRIWNYIDNNPLRWQEDQLSPTASFNRFNQE
jgi:putative transposase